MRRHSFLAITALLASGNVLAAQAAGVQAPATPGLSGLAPLAIRETGTSSSFEELLQRQMPPVPIAQAAIAALNLPPATLPAATLPAATLPPAPLSPAPAAPQPRVVRVINGQASWYGPGFFGNRTASGEVLRPGTYTAAHRSLAFGTRVRVHNLNNGRSTVVRINDRGPFHGSRVIDLAHGAARDLGLTASGTAQVRLEVLQ